MPKRSPRAFEAIIEDVQHTEPPAQILPSEAHVVSQELWMTSVQCSLKAPMQEEFDEAAAGSGVVSSSHGSHASGSQTPSADVWAEIASVQLSEDSWQASNVARPSNFGDAVHILQVTRAPYELRHALHHGRELESIRMQFEEAGHSCILGSGGSIFLYPQQYTAVQAIVSQMQLKPHFLVVNEAFLPLVLEAIRSIPPKANVRPRCACFLALVDDEGHEVCVVENTFCLRKASAIVQNVESKSEP